MRSEISVFRGLRHASSRAGRTIRHDSEFHVDMSVTSNISEHKCEAMKMQAFNQDEVSACFEDFWTPYFLAERLTEKVHMMLHLEGLVAADRKLTQ